MIVDTRYSIRPKPVTGYNFVSCWATAKIEYSTYPRVPKSVRFKCILEHYPHARLAYDLPHLSHLLYVGITLPLFLDAHVDLHSF